MCYTYLQFKLIWTYYYCTCQRYLSVDHHSSLCIFVLYLSVFYYYYFLIFAILLSMRDLSPLTKD